MREIDPGHCYQLDTLDGDQEVILTFVKREGEGYPYNVGHYAGTTIQEVCRALIFRSKYLQSQIPCEANRYNIQELRNIIERLEKRAFARHDWRWIEPKLAIEEEPTCPKCGHIRHECVL
jgi:hypothetical protein